MILGRLENQAEPADGVYEGVDAVAHLAHLGFDRLDDPDLIRGAVREAHAKASDTTRFHPPTYAGTVAQAETVGLLGEFLATRGWTTVQDQNFCTIVHEVTGATLAVTSGNKSTGWRDQTPRSRNPKGPLTHHVVHRNQTTLADFSPGFPRIPVSEGQTHYLLFYQDTQREEIRLEVALPYVMAENGQIAGWAKRMILEAIDLSQPAPVQEPEPRPIDVPVARRVSG